MAHGHSGSLQPTDGFRCVVHSPPRTGRPVFRPTESVHGPVFSVSTPCPLDHCRRLQNRTPLFSVTPEGRSPVRPTRRHGRGLFSVRRQTWVCRRSTDEDGGRRVGGLQSQLGSGYEIPSPFSETFDVQSGTSLVPSLRSTPPVLYTQLTGLTGTRTPPEEW